MGKRVWSKKRCFTARVCSRKDRWHSPGLRPLASHHPHVLNPQRCSRQMRISSSIPSNHPPPSLLARFEKPKIENRPRVFFLKCRWHFPFDSDFTRCYTSFMNHSSPRDDVEILLVLLAGSGVVGFIAGSFLVFLLLSLIFFLIHEETRRLS